MVRPFWGKTVAMESTGVYWDPVFEIPEQRGFEVMVVNVGHARHVAGAQNRRQRR
jgi:transposase